MSRWSDGDIAIDDGAPRSRWGNDILVEEAEPQGSMLKEAVKGVPRGAGGVLSSAVRGLGVLDEILYGTPGATRASNNPIYTAGEMAGEKVQQALPVEPGFEDSWTRKISEGVGGTVGFLAAGPTGPAGVALFGYLAATGDGYKEARAEGLSEGESRALSQIYGAIGTTDAIPIERLMKASKPVKQAFARRLVRGIADQMATEGGQEGFQAYSTDFAKRTMKGEDAWDALWNAATDPANLEEAAVGAVVGGIFGAGGAVSGNARAPEEQPTSAPPPEPLEAAPAPPERIDVINPPGTDTTLAVEEPALPPPPPLTPETFVAANPQVAAVVAAKETPSRKDFREAGLPNMPAEQRAEFAAKVRETMAAPVVEEQVAEPEAPPVQEEPLAPPVEVETAPVQPEPEVAPVVAEEPKTEPPQRPSVDATTAEGKRVFADPMIDDDLMSSRKADLDRELNRIGAEGVNSPERKKWEESKRKAIEKGLPAQVPTLVTEVLAEGRPLSDEETAAFTMHMKQRQTERNAILEQMRTADDFGEKKRLDRQLEKVNEELEATYRANDLYGMEWGRAGAIRKMTLDEDLNIVSVKVRAESAAGRALKQKEAAKANEIGTKGEELDAKIEKAKQALPDEVAETLVRNRKKREKRPQGTVSAERTSLVDRARMLMKAGCLIDG